MLLKKTIIEKNYINITNILPIKLLAKYQVFVLLLAYPVYNYAIIQILNIFGSYGIIYIFAQDAGLKTTTIQTNFIQSNTLFIVISMAYSINQNRSQSILALLLFYHLKYVISQNVID